MHYNEILKTTVSSLATVYKAMLKFKKTVKKLRGSKELLKRVNKHINDLAYYSESKSEKN